MSRLSLSSIKKAKNIQLSPNQPMGVKLPAYVVKSDTWILKLNTLSQLRLSLATILSFTRFIVSKFGLSNLTVVGYTCVNGVVCSFCFRWYSRLLYKRLCLKVGSKWPQVDLCTKSEMINIFWWPCSDVPSLAFWGLVGHIPPSRHPYSANLLALACPNKSAASD